MFVARPSRSACRLAGALVLMFAAGTAWAGFAPPAGEAAPRSERHVEDEIDWRGEISALDTGRRLITVRGDDGQKRTVPADARVEHFEHLRVGDRVHMRYHRSIVFDIQPAGSGEPGAYRADDGDVQVDEAGIERVESEVVTVLSPLVAVDIEGNTISVQDPAGRTHVLDVEKPEHRAALPRLKVGDMLRVRFLEGYAVSVQHAE